MRVCKKDYYNKLLENNKCYYHNNVKGTWNTINTIITKVPNKFDYPKNVNDNDKTWTNMYEVVDRFNNYFVNVGPKLAKDIKYTGMKCSVMDHVEKRTYKFFLGTVESKEIIEIVSKSKNKTSKDCDDIDMSDM